MREEFQELTDLLERGGPFDSDNSFTDGCHRRLVRALATGQVDGRLGPSDVVALVGHAFRREALLSPDLPLRLRVPSATVANQWPSPSTWRAASFSVLDEGERYRLTPRRWEPAWLRDRRESALTDPLFAGERRRTYEEVAGDPFLRAVGLTHYRCDGQREAIRAVLSVPDGSSVVVNLPTGAGKSLCAHLPALLMSQNGGVSIMVVPTTALALDQERAAGKWIPHATAYLGGQSASAEERRKSIRRRVREGSQRILFSSPEGVLGTLRPALYDATRKGLLRVLVVDEAHMVEQWGDEFRSAFQEVAGLRRDLRRCVPAGAKQFTTMMLTATLTETALDTLEALFGQPGPFAVVSAAQLRPEPSYWAVRAEDSVSQAAIVLESLRHLPRPLILYLTEPVHAHAWAQRLHLEGYRRVDVVTGDTPTPQRGAVIERWRNGDTDIVVATSAFGLGVDHDDVRVVVHAAIPESVDRFYQEVGRGGRDGAACASIVVYTPEDITRAKRMNQKKVIGIERGLERWTRMFEQGVALDGDRFRVPIDVTPSWSAGDIDMDNDLNRAWNVRTLTLMSRARLLDLDAEPPPVFGADDVLAREQDAEVEMQERYDRDLDEQRRHRVVSLCEHGHAITDVWERVVEPVRQAIAKADRRSHAFMLEVLHGSRDVGDILADAYTISPREPSRAAVPVARACGGCAHDRAIGRTPYADPMPTAFPQWPTRGVIGEVLEDLSGGAGGVGVFYNQLNPQRLSRFLQWLVGQGIRVVVMPAANLPDLSPQLYQPGVEGRWVFTYPLEGFWFLVAPRLPTVIYLPPRHPLPAHIQQGIERGANNASLRLLLAHSSTQDAERPLRLLREMFAGRTYTFEELCVRINL